MSTDGAAVLLVDDDRDDIEITIQAFGRAGFTNPIIAVHDQPDAIRYLRGEGEYADRSRFPLPGLVLLDHRIPGGEWEVLKWVRNEPDFVHLPVAILTGSEDPAYEKQAAQMGASAYHRKPHGFDEFVALIRRIAEFWLQGRGLTKPPQ